MRGQVRDAVRTESPAIIPSVVVKTNQLNYKEAKSCHEVTDKALQVGSAEELAEAEEWEGALEGGEWAALEQAPDQEGSVCAPNAALPPPIKPAYPATKYSAPSVALSWSENRKIRMTA